MSKHTAGPWAVASRQGDDWDSVVYLPDTPHEICQCFHDLNNVDECSANARLIAAAPDLLNALMLLAAAVPLDSPLDAKLSGIVRAAITKATEE